jgi:hypothetical protein
LEEVPMGTDSEVSLAHRLERNHLLDAVRVKVLELQPILERNHQLIMLIRFVTQSYTHT